MKVRYDKLWRLMKDNKMKKSELAKAAEISSYAMTKLNRDLPVSMEVMMNFVDPVTYSLAEAWVYYQDTRPFAIYSDDTIVGFVSMYVGEDNYQIINFLIDDAFQRKGYGSKAVKLCIEYLQREFSACRISAPVKMEHIAAQEFWIKQGFCLSDTIEDGYVFMRLFLT